MPYFLRWPFAFALACLKLAAICAAFFLCFSVAAVPVETEGKQIAPQRPDSGLAASAGTQASTEHLGRLAAEIETVGVMNRAQMGVGGMWTFTPKPVVLFRSGDALLDIGNLIRVTSLDADRAAHPKDWSRWRRSADGIEILQGEKWKKLDYPRTIQGLSAGFVLSGKYENLSGGGNTAIGGGELVAAQRGYTFQPDGKYSSSQLGFASSTEELDSKTVGHTVVRSQSPVTEGRYSVDGYLLRLEPSSRSPETHVLVFDPKDPNTLWIDGHGYTHAH